MKMKKKAEIPEVVGSKANVTRHVTFEGLPALAEHLREELSQFKLLEKEASWRALRIGILLHKAKTELNHGELMPWIEKNFPEYSYRHCHRFVELAEVFLRSQKLLPQDALMLCAPQLPKPEAEAMNKPPSARPVQLAFAFLGDLSLNELFKKYHVNTSAPVGGYHPRDPNAPEKPVDHEEQMAIMDWKALCEKLYRHALDKKTWLHLPNAKKCEAYDLITAAATEMREAVKTIRTVRH